MSYRRIAGEFVTPLSVSTYYRSFETEIPERKLALYQGWLVDADGHTVLQISVTRSQANLWDMANIARNLRWIAKEMNKEKICE